MQNTKDRSRHQSFSSSSIGSASTMSYKDRSDWFSSRISPHDAESIGSSPSSTSTTRCTLAMYSASMLYFINMVRRRIEVLLGQPCFCHHPSLGLLSSLFEVLVLFVSFPNGFNPTSDQFCHLLEGIAIRVVQRCDHSLNIVAVVVPWNTSLLEG